jgi:hypothetical protein
MYTSSAYLVGLRYLKTGRKVTKILTLRAQLGILKIDIGNNNDLLIFPFNRVG